VPAAALRLQHFRARQAAGRLVLTVEVDEVRWASRAAAAPPRSAMNLRRFH
jgi:hypothetical protein